ncbi:MAG: hypothetical protein HC913_08615 [Microscillaceae bacterium]|nr:hypothetical protein [Microscillaceae bacterium]
MAIIILLLIYAGRDEKRIIRQTEQFFKELDQKYEDYIDKKLNLAVVFQDKQEADIDAILKQVFTILKPNVDGILAYVNSITYSSIGLKHQTRYFKGASSLTQELFRSTGDGKTMTEEDRKRFYESFQDAIRADLTQRLIDLKANNYLS